MSVKDVQKLAQGLEAQKRAEKAFNRSNFEDALHYYSVAEACYRSAFSTPGDRVFFMQVSSLRCLEQSVEEGRIDFMPQLRDAVTSFFAEWEEKRIRECISLKKQTEAFAFKAWRSLKNIDNRFDKSTAAVNVGDYERARQLLQGIIESLRDSREPEADAQAAIARSKLEIVAVREELTKRVHERDRLRIAEAYQRAAEASVLPPGSRSCQRDRIQAYRFWFRSYENRFRAFTMLEDERRSRDPEEKLSTALDLLDAAVENAQAAVRSAIHNEFPYGDIYNLSYWKAVVEERLELYRFMTSSQGHFFEKACTAWRRR